MWRRSCNVFDSEKEGKNECLSLFLFVIHVDFYVVHASLLQFEKKSYIIIRTEYEITYLICGGQKRWKVK